MKIFYPLLLLGILTSGCADMSSGNMMKDNKMDTMSSDSMKTMDHDSMKKKSDMDMSGMSDDSM